MAGPHGLQRPPWRQTYTVLLPGLGGEFLPMPRWPIESVTSVALGSTTVDASSYSIAGEERSAIYADNGWYRSVTRSRAKHAIAGDEEHEYTVTGLLAGWVMPPIVSEWAASTAYSVGEFVRSTDASDLAIFECTTAGTSDATEPTWDTDDGDTTADNDVIWTARVNAREMPADLAEAGLITIMDWFSDGLSTPAGVVSERFEAASITYSQQRHSSTGGLPPHAYAIIRSYR